MKIPRWPLILGLLFFAAPIFLLGHTVGVETNKASGPLKPGEYYWKPEVSPRGPVVIVVSLPRQVMVVYRNGIQIARSTVSTGAGGKATPTGVFEILQKKEEHYSNIYNNAPMPYMQRLTWTGIALHAGTLPGYPASKGCIRLPFDFSKRLFTVTKMGGTVIIADEKSPRADFTASPGLALAPKDLSATTLPPLAKNQFQWMPERSSTGPVTLLISTADQKLYAYRNGILIGRGAIEIRGSRSQGEHVFTLLEGTTNRPGLWVPGRNALRWLEVTMGSQSSSLTAEELSRRLRIAPGFAEKLYDLVSPGTTVVVTDDPALRDADPNLTIIAND
ncbi:MAG TPA: L,D-transpeptidase [Candidatus Methylacidiphilales bacterium]|jgi:hypothetical protein|nr:L,D-transpeptidase [Candidatus Methylacidiphilales bacterium]